MKSQPIKLSFFAMGLAASFALAFPASAEPAKEPKQKKQVVTSNAKGVNLDYRGQNLFPAGPLYNGTDYLGDDPDPFIRLQIERDLPARYGGNE
jgi:hypothetical protein